MQAALNPTESIGEGSVKQINFQILSCKSEEMSKFPLRQLGKNEKIFLLWGQNSLGKMAQYNRNSLEKNDVCYRGESIAYERASLHLLMQKQTITFVYQNEKRIGQ